MKRMPADLQEITEETMRRIANIVGFQSAAAAAIKDFEERKALGLKPAFFVSPSTQMFFVGNDLGVHR